MTRVPIVAVGLLAALGVAVPAGAVAQEQRSGTITRAVDGDTLEVSTGGASVTVRLIGIDTPEEQQPGTPRECGASDASASMARWADQPVTLTTDPSQDRTDRFGRLLAYADVFGQDVGLTAIIGGLSDVNVYAGRPFARQPNYEAARDAARQRRSGAWSAATCDGDFHSAGPDSVKEDPSATPSRADTAEQFVRRHYFRLTQHRYSLAWGMLSATLRGRFGAYGSWRAGYRRTVGISVNTADASIIGDGRAVVVSRFRARDRDACTGGVRQQFFRARWVLTRRAGAWLASGVTASKVGGQRVRLSKSECPKPKPKPQRSPSSGGGGGGGGDNCHPSYSPCVPTGRDYDCGELNGPYTVTGNDPYRLDADNDGIGCE